MNIYINNGEGVPDDDVCYIVGKNGIYLKKTLELIESLTPVDKISFLEDVPTYAKMKIPKLPVKLFANIVGFFRSIHSIHGSEAIVLLYFNKADKSYKVYVPEQEVSAASLSYKSDVTVKDHMLIGSIHSHSSMSAFHSGTDVHDEAKFDGLHLTIGKVNDKTFFDVCGTIAVNGMRVPIVPEEYIDGLEVREYTNYFPTMFRPGFEMIDGIKEYKKDVKSSAGYILNCDEEYFKYPDKWLQKVSKKVYTTNYGKSYGYGGYSGYGRVYSGLFAGKKYVIRDGKLVEADENPKQATFADYEKLLKDLDKDNGITPEDPFDCMCKTCLFRSDKLKLQDIEGIPDSELENNRVPTSNWWDEGLGD